MKQLNCLLWYIIASNGNELFADTVICAADSKLSRQFTECHCNTARSDVPTLNCMLPLIPRRARHHHQRPARKFDENGQCRLAVVGKSQHCIRQQVQCYQPFAPQPPVIVMWINGRTSLWKIFQIAELYRNKSRYTGIVGKSINQQPAIQGQAGKRSYTNLPLLEIHLRPKILTKTK